MKKKKKIAQEVEHKILTEPVSNNYINYIKLLVDKDVESALVAQLVERLPHEQWSSPIFRVRFPAKAPTILLGGFK